VPASASPRLAAEKLTRILPGPVPVTLVEDIDLAILPGEFVAIVGASGSGKSSLLYLLGLLDRPTAGRVWIEGRDASELDRDTAAALRLSRLGFVFQFHFLLPEFTVLDNVLIPMRRLGALPVDAMRARAEAILASLGIADKAGRRPDALSGGERQRAAIARALANDPPIVLADEPTGNLDSRNADQVFTILGRLAREEGRSIVVVTHATDLAARTDRRLVLVDGRLDDTLASLGEDR
jgi:lipoprotein-releasing system ATP-binding protein